MLLCVMKGGNRFYEIRNAVAVEILIAAIQTPELPLKSAGRAVPFRTVVPAGQTG